MSKIFKHVKIVTFISPLYSNSSNYIKSKVTGNTYSLKMEQQSKAPKNQGINNLYQSGMTDTITIGHYRNFKEPDTITIVIFK